MKNQVKQISIFIGALIILNTIPKVTRTEFFDGTPFHLENPKLAAHIGVMISTLGIIIYRLLSNNKKAYTDILRYMHVLNIYLISPSINHIKNLEGANAILLNILSLISNLYFADGKNNLLWLILLIFQSGFPMEVAYRISSS